MGVYEEFDKIVQRSYSPEDVVGANLWADEMFADLDNESVDNLCHSMSCEEDFSDYDEENDEFEEFGKEGTFEYWFDFPEPPEISF